MEDRIPVGAAALYVRTIGKGLPVIVLHGGPDFDHGYFVPELDRLSEVMRLIYYDQRGRGQSAENVKPQDVSLASELDDIDRVRKHFQLDAVVLLGHSWGAVLALEYALRKWRCVSHLILMNPASISTANFTAVRKVYLERLGADMNRQRAIVEGAGYQAGEPDVVAARYRIHFKTSLCRPADYETMMTRMGAGLKSQGKDGILMARAIEDRLMHETWEQPDYDLGPKLSSLEIPTLVMAGDTDFLVGAAEPIAQAIPGAQLMILRDCGHFAYLERPDEVYEALTSFLGVKSPRGGATCGG